MFTTRPDLEGTFGMVAATHWLAAQSGMAVLEAGGNAFDAAVAAGFVLQVVEPHLNGPGGEVPIVAWDARQAAPFVICGQGTAPRAATPQAFADLGLDMVPGTGLLPATVPGAFGGWMTLLRDRGTMTPEQVLRYAISYARDGFPVLPRVAATVDTVTDLFTEHWPTSAALWLQGGSGPAAHTLRRNPALADTYQRIVDESARASGSRERQIDAAIDQFYRGFVAERIAEFCRDTEARDTSGRSHRGLLTENDLAEWSAATETPLAYDYAAGGAEYTVLKAGPWSQAPVFMQQLALLAHVDLSGMTPGSPDFIHTVVEAGKLAFADREAFYGDPLFVDVPIADLLSPEYNAARAAMIGESADVGPLRPGSPDGRAPVLPRLLNNAAPDVRDGSVGEPTVRSSAARSVSAESAAGLAASPAGPPVTAAGQTNGDTCHVDVVDRWGNMVSAMPSGGWLQSSPAIPGLGFCLGTRGQMFWLEPGLPNSLAPGKRPRTTLSPTLALRDGEPYLAFGSPGGDQQDQWQLQMFLRHVHFGQTPQQAIDEVAWQSDHVPSSFYPRGAEPGVLRLESRADPATVAELRRRGHRVILTPDWSLGRLSAVSRDGSGMVRGAANPRDMQGYAVGR